MGREILTTGPEEHFSDQNDKPKVVDVIITSLKGFVFYGVTLTYADSAHF